ncbi:hypothetical protein ANO14919_139890 [Xylariales sp. No.14919]|nr:hypothetical protein ANO14919_139890 [Xylariales sp. No.14919]
MATNTIIINILETTCASKHQLSQGPRGRFQHLRPQSKPPPSTLTCVSDRDLTNTSTTDTTEDSPERTPNQPPNALTTAVLPY